MNKKNVENLISRIKADLASLEKELLNTDKAQKNQTTPIEKEKDYKHMRYHILYDNQEHGGRKGFTKRDVFKFIISKELENKSVEELNKIFALKYFPKIAVFGTYPYIIEEAQLPSYTKYIQNKYLQLQGTYNKKTVYVLGEWAQFGNIEEQTPGNFPVLIKIAKKLGYKIKEVEK